MKAWSIACSMLVVEDRQPAVFLHALQQVAHLDVRVAIVAVLHFAALPEQRIRFIEEKNGAARPRSIENAREVLLRFADVLCSPPGSDRS